MVYAGRRKSIAFFAAHGAGLILITLLLYIGWVILGWGNGILLVLGVLLLALIISGVVLNTIFLIREIRKNEQHDAFINAVTHELKTPVASIRLYLETLQAREVDEAKRREFYAIMLEDSSRLLASIEQVLRTGKLAGSKASRIPVELDPIIDRCVGRARVLHRLDAESLSYRAGTPVTVLGDADELEAAVSNLVENAVKYSSARVKVDVELAPAEGRYASVRVKDRGVGIPRSELKNIFNRFYRVPGPLAARVRGAGLGLYIVRSVARRHSGRVWVESGGPGHGSTFVLQLPVA